MSIKTVIFLMGPTASGKTDLAIQIANHFKVRLISVDSALIYKGMDIGSAKPDTKTLEKYPHYLINICKPQQTYSAYDFILDAKTQIKQAFINDEIPLLVGGTSFYFNALEHGLSKLPKSTTQSRAKVSALLKKHGLKKLHAILSDIDSKTAKKIHYNDSQRIGRALEVFFISGKTLNSLQGNKKPIIKYPIKKIILLPDRSEIRLKIKKRFLLMLEKGLIEEVKNIIKDINLEQELPSMRCVGYRQVLQYLQGKTNKSTMISNAITATCQLCKRQYTWLRREKNGLILKKINMQNITKYIRF